MASYLEIEDTIVTGVDLEVLFSLREVVIPRKITEIGRGAFDGCLNLESVTIPNSVVRIGDYAFDGCKSLTGIVLPKNLTEIGDIAPHYKASQSQKVL